VTLGEWLRERSPAAPERLLARIERALGERVDVDASEAGNVCIDAAEAMLGDLLRQSSTGRESALDLLAVDALVTYAFEAASESPGSLSPLAQESLIRLASVTRT
jgi:hypothetical protein